jgi:hypothetical protein
MEWMNNEGVGWNWGGCVYPWNEYLMDEKVDLTVERQ